jgi:hypothetical protein
MGLPSDRVLARTAQALETIVWFLAFYVRLGVVGVLTIQYASEGRFLTNIVDLTFLGTDAQRSGAAALGTTLGFLREFAPVIWGLTGLVLMSLVLAIRARALDVYQLAFARAVLIP